MRIEFDPAKNTTKALSIHMPTAEEDSAITAAAKNDPDAQPLTPAQLKAMIPMKDISPPPHSHKTRVLRPYR
jgi:hypothetical protein